jgi:hypothetical protein
MGYTVGQKSSNHGVCGSISLRRLDPAGLDGQELWLGARLLGGRAVQRATVGRAKRVVSNGQVD